MVSVSKINTISFTGKKDVDGYKGKTAEEKKEAAKKVVEGGGASALVAKGAMSKARKGGLDMFSKNNIKTIGAETKNAIEAAKAATNAIKMSKVPVAKAKSLWGICKMNAKNITDDIMKWAGRMKKSKFLKPILESKLFMKFAGALGFGFGVVTLISGVSDIVSTTTDICEKGFNKKDNKD